MNDEFAMDEVTDLIASIEMHRKEIERESGLEASREYALRRLQQALDAEQELQQREGATPLRVAIAGLLAAEVKRVGSLSRSSAQRPAQSQSRNRPQQQQQRNFRHDGQRQGRKPGGGGGGRRNPGRNSGR